MRISDWSSDVCSSDLLAAPGGGKLHPDVAAEARGEAILGVGQLLAFGGELALPAIEDVDELEQQRARSREQYRPLERRGVIAPEDRGGGRRTPIGKTHLLGAGAFDLDRRRTERADEIERDRKSTRLNSSH